MGLRPGGAVAINVNQVAGGEVEADPNCASAAVEEFEPETFRQVPDMPDPERP